MTADAALTLLRNFVQIALIATGPLLLVALFTGVFVGLIQTATQINEASLSYVVKVLAMVLTLVAIGPALGAQVVSYTRKSIAGIAEVVR
jgi:flagellar biosynthetic protein FliQ